MKCSFCGHDVPEGDNYCPFGGKKMPTVQNNPTCEEEKKTGSVEHPVASTPDVLLLSSDGRGERRKVLLGRDHRGLVRNRLVRGCVPLLSDFLALESWIHPLLRKRR